jgi:hypothetical protein
MYLDFVNLLLDGGGEADFRVGPSAQAHHEFAKIHG